MKNLKLKKKVHSYKISMNFYKNKSPFLFHTIPASFLNSIQSFVFFIVKIKLVNNLYHNKNGEFLIFDREIELQIKNKFSHLESS